MDSEGKLTELLSKMKEQILQKPEHERSVAQLDLCRIAERRAYVEPPVNKEEERERERKRKEEQKQEEERAKAREKV